MYHTYGRACSCVLSRSSLFCLPIIICTYLVIYAYLTFYVCIMIILTTLASIYVAYSLHCLFSLSVVCYANLYHAYTIPSVLYMPIQFVMLSSCSKWPIAIWLEGFRSIISVPSNRTCSNKNSVYKSFH